MKFTYLKKSQSLIANEELAEYFNVSSPVGRWEKKMWKNL